MRLSAFLEAWVQLVLKEGNGPTRKANSITEFVKGVTALGPHHKVAEAPSQPQRYGELKRSIQGSGTDGWPLL